MTRPAWLFNRDDPRRGITRELAEGVTTRIFPGEHSMLSLVRVAPRSAGAVHEHPEEQWGYLLEGECVRIQGSEEFDVVAGDFWHTPPNVPHGVRTESSAAVILDVFSPPRAEYRGPGAGFASGSSPHAVSTSEPSAATIFDAARTGALPRRIAWLYGGPIRGSAFPVCCAPGDNYWLHRAVYQAAPGDVLVASTCGAPEFGYWGDILNTAAIRRSLGGLVLDGCVRDGEELERMGLPVFATGRCPVGTSKRPDLGGSMGQPVRIGACTIRPGDLVVGDADGVVLVERDSVDATLQEARRRQVMEEDVRRRVLEGQPTLELPQLGLRDSDSKAATDRRMP